MTLAPKPDLFAGGAGNGSLIFLFDGQQVGYFEGIDSYPAEAGRYRYMPFRGPGHYSMGEQCQRTGFARCAYIAPGRFVWFTARGSGEYGVLEISDIGDAP